MFKVDAEFDSRKVSSIQAKTFFDAVNSSRQLLKDINAIGANCTIYEDDMPVALITWLDCNKMRGRILGMVI